MNSQSKESISNIDIEHIKDKINQIVRHSALDRVELHSRKSGFELEEVSDPCCVGQVLGSWMSIILVSGEPIRITLKFHFDRSSAGFMSPKLYGVDTVDQITDGQLVDFFKELSNLTAGNMIKIFKEVEIPLGISLPLCTRGFNEIFSDYQTEESPIIKYSDIWQLSLGELSFSGTVMVEILKVEELKNLIDYELDASDDHGEFGLL